MSVVEHTSHGPAHGAGAPPHRRNIFMRPGFVRGIWCFALFFLIGLYLVAGIRWLAGWDPIYDWNIIVLVGGLTLGPVGFLLGIGSFDYWLYWVSGRPTKPDDHANHGAYQVEGLLQGQHRPQGDRRPVPRDDVRLLHARRPDGDALPRRAGAARHAVHGHADLQRPRLHARGADDLRLHHPCLRGPRELRGAADARCPRHGLPAAERALVLVPPDRGHDVPLQLPRPRRRLRDRLDELRAARIRAADRPGLLQHGRPVGRRLLDPDGAQLPRHDHHDAGARE